MPKRQPQGNAVSAQGDGTTIRFGTTILLAATSFTTPIVFGQALPTLTAWFLQTAGAVGGSVQLQFAHGQTGAGPDFQPLTIPIALVLATPSNHNTPMGAYFYRAVISAPAANGVTVRWWLAARAG